jgi:MYXO-CTERM domain-containing protein
MTTRATTTKAIFLAGLLSLGLAGGARAATNPASCVNDIQCVATPNCGGEVCDFNRTPTMTCKAAGTDPKGADGWCTVDSDCKCFSLGARCVSPYCTFTLPSQAPDAGSAGTGGSAGSGGSGGTTSSGGGGGGCSIAGTSPLGGTLAFVVVGLVARALRRRRSARV